MPKLKNVLLVVLWVLIVHGTAAQSLSFKVDSIIHLITTETYRAHFDSLRTFSSSFRKVVEGSYQCDDHDNCRDYIFRSFKEYLGEENVYIQNFNQENYRGLANVIGFKQGTDKQKGIIVVSAHYDTNNAREESRSSCSPGANDNGTGLAAILEIARVLSSVETDCSVLFAAWDFEEQFMNGLPTGSNRWYIEHVRKGGKRKKTTANYNLIDKEKIIANINFDMFGNPHDTINGKPVLWACSGNSLHRRFTDEYVEVLNRYIPTVKAINKGLLTYSDHYTFAFRKIPAVENLESGYHLDPFYHTCSDQLGNPDNIDFTFATEVTKGGFAFLLEKVLKAKAVIQTSNKFDLITINEAYDFYSIQFKNEGIILKVTDLWGKSVPLYCVGGLLLIYPPQSGLYHILVFESGYYQSTTHFLQKKDGLPIPN